METTEDLGKRTLDDVESVLEFAKLEREEIKPLTQTIYFSDQLENDVVKLVELDSAVLKALEAGERVVIRGDKEDHAVLCTESQTYDIKQGEVSNTMLLLPDLEFSADVKKDSSPDVKYRQVGSVIHTFLELRPCKPRLQKLRKLLEENPYSGQVAEGDEDHQGQKYSMADILDTIQASEAEINTALQKMQALIIDGYWRVLDFDFLVQVVGHLLQLCDENDWTNTGIPVEECVNVLQELFPKCVIEHVIRNFADKIQTTSEEEDENRMQIDIEYYRLNEDKVCRFFAEQILKHARKGLALVDRETSPEVISYLPVETLPEDISERFNFLFRIREKWTSEEITPYISDLASEKLDVKAMLTKFARASMSNGIKEL